MGMFDSFIVEDGGAVEEIQTKQLDCALRLFYLGDRVMEAKGGRYLVEDDLDGVWWGFVIWDGVWVDTLRAKTEDGAHGQTQDLLARWKDPEFRAKQLLHSIGRYGQVHRALEKLSSELYILHSCRRDPTAEGIYFREKGKEYRPRFLASPFPAMPAEERLPYLVGRVIDAYDRTFGAKGGIVFRPTTAGPCGYAECAEEESSTEEEPSEEGLGGKESVDVVSSTTRSLPPFFVSFVPQAKVNGYLVDLVGARQLDIATLLARLGPDDLARVSDPSSQDAEDQLAEKIFFFFPEIRKTPLYAVRYDREELTQYIRTHMT